MTGNGKHTTYRDDWQIAYYCFTHINGDIMVISWDTMGYHRIYPTVNQHDL